MITFRPTSIFNLSGEVLRQTNNAKSWLYAICALLLSSLLSFSPIVVAIWLLFQGEWLAAIWVPIVMYVAIGFYLAFWPFIALLSLITGWINYGFLPSFLGTIIFIAIMFVLISGPEWLMYRANKAAEKASMFAQHRVDPQDYHEPWKGSKF